MNQHTSGDWQDLSQVWRAGAAHVTHAEIERLHERQRRRLRVARAAELACTIVGVVAAVWLAAATRFRWLGVLTAVFAVASVIFVLRARREPVMAGPSSVLSTLDDALAYQDWLAGQLRHGRVLGFVALFAVVIAASTQLMHMANATRSGLLATALAACAIAAALAWNMALAWQVWRRTARLQAFRKGLRTSAEDLAAESRRYPQGSAGE